MSSADAARLSCRDDRPAVIGALRWRDERAVAMLLARAFVADPLVIAICDATPSERQRRMTWSFRIAVRRHWLTRQPGWTVVDRRHRPVGVVLLTGTAGSTPASADALFALRGLWHVGLRTTMRGATAADLIAAQAPPTPFTYLRTLAVDPVLHRQGIGSQLIAQAIRTSSASLPIYLETATPQNLAFYARHGFDCVGEFRCLGVAVWRLIRPAGGQAPS